MPRPLNGYLTVKGAAQLLGVSAETLRNWDRSDKLKPHRHPVNGYRLYRREDLEAILQRAEGPASPGTSLTEGGSARDGSTRQ
jgi:excisionase family DNA binding protein